MNIEVQIYGQVKNIQGWLRLMNQERVPYRYMGCKPENFGPVNIIVGVKQNNLKNYSNKIFIIEPTVGQVLNSGTCSVMDSIYDQDLGEIKTFSHISLKDRKEQYLGTFKTHKIYNNDIYSVANIDKNSILLNCNLSGQLKIFGFTNNLMSLQKDNIVLAHFTPIDNAGILRFMRKMLIKAFDIVNIPYVHLWYYPTNDPSVLLFRQDVDFVHRNGLRKTRDVCKKFGITGTYFVNIDGGEEFDDDGPIGELPEPTTLQRKALLERLFKEGNEMANHGYIHEVYSSEEDNLKNIQRCSDYLQKIFTIKEKGYASPGGIYTLTLARAMEKAGLEYSSNCSLGSDGFPYYPQFGGFISKILEIPFHLISDATYDPFTNKDEQQTVVTELLAYIDRQINNGEPVAIMGHPHLAGRVADKIYSPVFEKIKKKKIPVWRLDEFAQWWKKRQQIKFEYRLINGEVRINSENGLFAEIIQKSKSKNVVKVM